MTALQFFGDVRILAAMLAALLGAAFLVFATPRSWPYVKWIAGSTLLYGATGLAFRSAELWGWVPQAAAGPVGSAISAVVFTVVLGGLQAYFNPAGWAPWKVTVGTAVPATLAVLGVTALSRGWPFAGPSVLALLFVGASVWMIRLWRRDRWAGQLWLAACFLLHPLLLSVAVDAGLSLAQFRMLTPLPITSVFVLLITLILARDARLLLHELRERERADTALRQLADSLDDQVRERTQRIADVNRGLRAFAGMVSHDLRGPVGNVGNLADLALRAQAEGAGDSLTGYLQLIRSESNRAVDMVSDLLTLARADEAPIAREPVDMHALAADCVRALALQYGDAERVVALESLPAVPADAGLMRHVVINLLSNALKFGAGRSGLEVRVQARREGDHWRFAVADNGPGFDPALAERLFEPFVRLPGGGTAGTGIGLTVVRRVVERHGGRVGVDARPGHGATFWWTLPAPA